MSNKGLPWPQDLWVVWSPGMRPWACLNEASAQELAYFCHKNGHFDIEIQRYGYDPAYKRILWEAPKEVLTPPLKAGIQKAQTKQDKPIQGITKKAPRAKRER